MADAELYMVRWKGRQLGPFSKKVILEKLSAGELSLLHEIKMGDQWITVGSFLPPVQNRVAIETSLNTPVPPLIFPPLGPAAGKPSRIGRTIGWTVMILMVTILVVILILFLRSNVVPPVIPAVRSSVKATNAVAITAGKEQPLSRPESNAVPATLSNVESVAVAPVAPPVKKTLVLQPGPATGHNCYVAKLSGRGTTDPTHNEPELPVTVWTVNGAPLIIRSLIKFTELAQIPAGAKVISARLYLSGVPASRTVPQGNSCYPGSPYNTFGENKCIVERVVGGNWDERTLTFDTQPASTTNGQALVLASTSQWKYDAVVDVSPQAQAMVDEPLKNFGFVIKMQTEQTYRSVNFASSAASDATVRPKLVVEYQ